MKKRSILLLVGLLLIALHVIAQGKEVPVEVVVDKLSYSHIRGFLEHTTEAVYKFYKNEISPQNYIADKGCLRMVSKDVEKTQVLADDPVLAPNRIMRPFTINTGDGIIRIRMEAFEDDKGDPCGYDKGDDNYITASLDIKLADLDPGVFSAPYIMAGKDRKMWAEIRVRYGLPLPAPIKHRESMPVNNVGKVVELESLLALDNKKNLNYQWEFQLEGSSEWKQLGKTISESVVFYPIRDVLKTPIKTNQLIKFRMKAFSKELAGEYVNYEAKFTPEPPEFDGATAVLTQSCSGSPTGTIGISDVKCVTDKYAFYIVKGKTLEEQDQPDLAAPAKKIKWGTVNSGAPLKVEGLAEGTYTIVIYNAGMEVGKMFGTHTFPITQFPALTIKSSEVKEATCSNTPDGQILIESEGGNTAKLTYLISPAVGKQQVSGRTVVFSELLPGSYAVVVKDACNQLVTKDLDVPRKVAQLKGQLAIKTEAVNEFANGSVNVSMEEGSGKYRYSILRNNSLLFEKETGTPGFVIDRLAKGTYQLKVTDLNASKCPGWDTVFSMTAKLIIADSAVQNKDTTAKESNAAKTWSAQVVTPKVSDPTVRRASFSNDAPDKNINSFAAYVRTGPAQKRYYIVIEKSRYEMKIYNALDNTLIVTYPVVFGSNELDEDKMTEGDRHTPEGEFKIIEKKMHEKWRRFLALDFPNEDSYAKFNARKAKGEIPRDARIGGEIGIHGTLPNEGPAVDRLENWTMGCISTKNEYIDELYLYIPVGTKVIIKK